MPSPRASDETIDLAKPTLIRAGSGVRVVSRDTPFKAGDRVSENIQLVSLLGVGGMGDVWRANHIGLDTAVAVKFMSAPLARDRALIERFAREAKLASRIKSPHVVQVFDFATTHEGLPYIVMELIEGETLEARIRSDAKLGLEETSRILVQICRALSKTHGIGIVHRDMKPANVLLGEDGGELFVKILDFGIARSLDASPKGVTGADATMGTPEYMSPEQLFHAAEVDHRSDLWALGVMTYRCLTGLFPFQGDSFGAVCLAIDGGAYPAASKLNPEIPRAMDTWFATALARLPDERFRSAKDMSDAYLLILEGANQLPLWAARKDTLLNGEASYPEGTSALPANLIPARHARARRRRAAAIVVGAAMLVAVGFLGRDAMFVQFVKTHVSAERAAQVDSWRAALASHTSQALSRVVSPNVMAIGVPSSAAPVSKLPLPRPIAKAAQDVPPVLARVVPVATASAPSEPSAGKRRIRSGAPAASASESNPDSDGGTSAAPAAQTPDTRAAPLVVVGDTGLWKRGESRSPQAPATR